MSVTRAHSYLKYETAAKQVCGLYFKPVRNMDINTISLPPPQTGPITRGLTHKHHCPHELDEVIARRPSGELCWNPPPLH